MLKSSFIERRVLNDLQCCVDPFEKEKLPLFDSKELTWKGQTIEVHMPRALD